jgi:high frequency lysogenization protein
MLYNQRAQTIALTAVCQSAILIQDVARGKILDADILKNVLGGIMTTSPNSVLDVYPSLTDLSEGSKVMIIQLAGKAGKKDVLITRYIAQILSISKTLLKKPKALAKLKQELDNIERRLEHFELDDMSIIENFADAYSKVISPLKQKIQVVGNPDILRQPNAQHKVRAILLAGVRAAVLWRQMGGKRRQFLFNRKKLLTDAILFNKDLSIQ